MKSKKKNKKLRNQSKTYKIVVPYAIETTTLSYNKIKWSE